MNTNKTDHTLDYLHIHNTKNYKEVQGFMGGRGGQGGFDPPLRISGGFPHYFFFFFAYTKLNPIPKHF